MPYEASSAQATINVGALVGPKADVFQVLVDGAAPPVSKIIASVIQVRVDVKNIGDTAAPIWCEILDRDTATIVGARQQSALINPGASTFFTFNLTMPNKTWNLRAQAAGGLANPVQDWIDFTVNVATPTLTISISASRAIPGGTIRFSGTTTNILDGQGVDIEILGSDAAWHRVGGTSVGANQYTSGTYDVPFNQNGKTPCQTWSWRANYLGYTSGSAGIAIAYKTQIVNLSGPATAKEGDTITVSGTLQINSASGVWGALAGKSVAITYDGASKGSPTTDASGNFSQSFVIPAGTGTHTIAASYAGTTAGLILLLSITAPPLALLLAPVGALTGYCSDRRHRNRNAIAGLVIGLAAGYVIDRAISPVAQPAQRR
jgi:hypothetical protein